MTTAHGSPKTPRTPAKWDEAGEPVGILESLEFTHPLIVTSFRWSGKGVRPEENSGLPSL